VRNRLIWAKRNAPLSIRPAKVPTLALGEQHDRNSSTFGDKRPASSSPAKSGLGAICASVGRERLWYTIVGAAVVARRAEGGAINSGLGIAGICDIAPGRVMVASMPEGLAARSEWNSFYAYAPSGIESLVRTPPNARPRPREQVVGGNLLQSKIRSSRTNVCPLIRRATTKSRAGS